MGARAYTLIQNHLENITGAVVEIGSERNEGSTTFLHKICKENDIKFYTVDFNELQYLNAKMITNGNAYNMTGEHFFEHIFPSHNEKVSFAYLDNFDLVTHDGRNWDRRKSLYHKHGLNMFGHNNDSKQAHLTQAMYVEKFSADKCFVLIDDTWIDDVSNVIMGKGAYAVGFLLESEFKLLNCIFKGNEVEGLKNGYAFLGRTL